jgi:hypothetical protein
MWWVGLGLSQILFIIYYVYAHSGVLQWQNQVEKTRVKQCIDIIRMKRLVATE